MLHFAFQNDLHEIRNAHEPFLESLQKNHVNQANFWLDEMNSKNPSAATLLNYV